MTQVASFAIHHTQLIGADGQALGPLPPFAQEPAELIRLYRAMVRIRRFDAKAITVRGEAVERDGVGYVTVSEALCYERASAECVCLP